ncbi:MAG: helix-turn-helix domain-containing protein [Vulcanimicrobiota bacterium]
MSLGKRIAKLRRAREWTQSQFADKVGVHHRHISRWETDKNRPSLSMLERIAKTFEVSVGDLTEIDSRRSAGEILHDDRLLPSSNSFRLFPKKTRARLRGWSMPSSLSGGWKKLWGVCDGRRS